MTGFRAIPRRLRESIQSQLFTSTHDTPERIERDSSGPEDSGAIGEINNGNGTQVGTDTETPVRGDDLTIGYDGEPVIEDQTIEVPEGEITAIVGPNGSGKSTLLTTLANQLYPEEGVVSLDGREVEEYDSKALARRLGLLSQRNTAPDSLTVESLVGYGRYPYQGFLEPQSSEDRAAIDRAISRVGIEHLRDQPAGELSGGQQQLAWLAVAFAQEPDVLMLDEPTTFLDLHHQLRVLEAVEAINKAGRTVVVVLHDIEQAARLADRMIVLDDGKIEARGNPHAVVEPDLLRSVFGVEADVEIVDGSVRVVPHCPACSA